MAQLLEFLGQYDALATRGSVNILCRREVKHRIDPKLSMTVLSSYTIVSVNNIYQCCTGKSPLFSSLFVEDQIFLTTLKFGKFQSGNMFY